MSSHITIADAASRLGRKPFEVVRLIDAGLLRQVVLVDEASVDEMLKENQ